MCFKNLFKKADVPIENQKLAVDMIVNETEEELSCGRGDEEYEQ